MEFWNQKAQEIIGNIYFKCYKCNFIVSINFINQYDNVVIFKRITLLNSILFKIYNIYINEKKKTLDNLKINIQNHTGERNMKTFKKLILTSIQIVLALTISGCNKNKDNKDNDIKIIYTNDIHCAINTNISFAAIKQFKNNLQKTNKDVLLVDAGDAIEGGAYGTISKGEVLINAMNEVEYDICAIGNHEFNYGIERLKELINMANATYLNTNVVYKGNKDDWINHLPTYKVVKTNLMKIGFLGITTPYTPSNTAPSLYKENNETVYQFDFGGKENFYSHIQSTIDQLKNEEKVDKIIALGHLGTSADDPSLYPYSSKDIVNNTYGLTLDNFINTLKYK